MNHTYFPLRSMALKISQDLHNLYVHLFRFGCTPSDRRLGLYGRSHAIVLVDRVMAGEKRGLV